MHPPANWTSEVAIAVRCVRTGYGGRRAAVRREHKQIPRLARNDNGVSFRQEVPPAPQELALDDILGALYRCIISRDSVPSAAEPPEKIGAHDMKHRIVFQRQLSDDPQRSGGPFDLGDSNCAI